MMKRRLFRFGLVLAIGLGATLIALAPWKAQPFVRPLDDRARSLVTQLRDEDPQVRIYAVKALYFMVSRDLDGMDPKVMDKELIPALAEALNDEERRVVSGAERTLAILGSRSPNAIRILVERLTHENANARRQAAGALGLVTEPDAVIGSLVAALEDEEPSVRRRAADSLRSLVLKKLEHVPTLIKAMQNKDSEVRRQIGYALGELGAGARDAVPALSHALADKDEGVRFAAAWSLSKIGQGGEAAAPVLARALKNESRFVRQTAAEALRDIGPAAKGALPALRAALQDEDFDVRAESAYALWKVGGQAEEALPVILEAFRSVGGERCRDRALNVLCEMGPSARAAVPALIRLAREGKPDWERPWAAFALDRIDPGAAKTAGIP